MSTRLIFVRHGVTEWNHLHRYQGHTDINLSEEGIQQALLLQKRMTREKIDTVISSDLSRSYQTAQIIAEPHGLKVQIYPALKEINFGLWEGLTYQQIEKDYPDLLKIWLERPHELLIPKGESFNNVKDRSVECIKEILKSKVGDTILTVTHGGTLAALICGLLDQPLLRMWDYRHKNTAITEIEAYNGKFRLTTVNDTSHLDS